MGGFGLKFHRTFRRRRTGAGIGKRIPEAGRVLQAQAVAEAGDWVVEAEGDVDRERAVEQGNVVNAVEIANTVGPEAGGGIWDLLGSGRNGDQTANDQYAPSTQ